MNRIVFVFCNTVARGVYCPCLILCLFYPTVPPLSLDDSVYTSGYKAFIIDHPVSENIQKYCGDQELCYPSTFCGHYALGGSVVFFVGNENKNKFYFRGSRDSPC